MCGIAGIVRFKGEVELGEIEEITESLAHRGPDGEGIWSDDAVALGHQRLSIIDPKMGQQPMSNEDESIWVTFNGEIYNFRELRDQLIQKGYRFRTQSDTEVIIYSYEEWKEECVNYFRGMFAFGVVDKKRRKIFLARDHFGIKPLVYYQDSSCFAFASEIQALKKIKDVRLDVDYKSLDQYLWLQYIPAPRSIYHQVQKLPPAHCMSVSFDGEISGPRAYWSLRFCPNTQKSQKEWLEELDAVLEDSVKAHLVSDVPFGAFLSGGVDSSAVVSYMAKILDKPVKTFTIGFEEEEFNELKYAQLVAKRWSTEHHFEIVKPKALEILPKLVQHYGEPFGDCSAIPTYYVSKLARQYVPMVLSGDGGDESFAGYHTYLTWMKFLSGDFDRERPPWKKMLYPLAHRLFPGRYPKRLRSGPRLENWLNLIQYIPTPTRYKLWRSEYSSHVNESLDIFEHEYKRVLDYSNSHKVQSMDFNTYLPFAILTKVDTASMLNSLEVRTPWVDRRVIEFAATIPESFNIRKVEGGQWQGKLLLKELMVKYYPRDFLSRFKMGFSVPIQKWFSKDGELHDEIHERLMGSGSTLKEYFEPRAVQGIMNENRPGPVWLLLFLEEWLRQNK